MKCIVTGATGHIGNVLVRELHEAGYQITALVLPNDDVRFIEPFCDIVYGNILNKPSLIEIFTGADLVFHLAGIVEIGSGKKKILYKVNVEGTKNCVDAAIEAGVKRFVYTSSVHAIPELPKWTPMTEIEVFDPKTVRGNYAKTKALATSYVLSRRGNGTEIVIVHPSGVIGPSDHKLSNVSQMFIDCLCGRLSAYLKGGYNFVDVRDLARGIRLAAEKGRDGECYILSGSEITVKQLLDEITEGIGRKPITTKLSFWFILAMSYFAEVYYKLAKQKPLFTHYSIIVLNSNYRFSNQKAVEELGFSVRDIKETIQDTLEFAKTNFVTKIGKRYIRKPLDKD